MNNSITIDVTVLQQKKAKALASLSSLQSQVDLLRRQVDEFEATERVLAAMGVPVASEMKTPVISSGWVTSLPKAPIVAQPSRESQAELIPYDKSLSNKKAIYQVMQGHEQFQRDDIVRKVLALKPDANPQTVIVEISRMCKNGGLLASLGRGIYQLQA